MYKVKEIFRSIQGEGYNTGRESVFLRFSGCNYWNGNPKDRKNSKCSFCDTDFIGVNGKNGGIYNLRELIKKVENVWESSFTVQKKFIILTGGEPLLQVDQDLVNMLKEKNFFVAIETNGSINSKINFDWTCVSPKDPKSWLLKKGDELKIIYPQNIFNLKELLYLDFKHFFLQPKYDSFSRLNFNKTIEYCKLHRQWFPSFQLHKTMGIM